jgi:hypothetical protein
MTQRPIYLTNASSDRLASLNVSIVGDHFEGTIDLKQLPDQLRQLFAEFEDVVESQMISLLDPVEERVRAAQLRLAWEGGESTPVDDLQVYPSTGAVSFRATPPASVALNGQAATDRLMKEAGLRG